MRQPILVLGPKHRKGRPHDRGYLPKAPNMAKSVPSCSFGLYTGLGTDGVKESQYPT
jgi:hypothetical protein